MHFIRPSWLTHAGEKRQGEVYSVHVSPDSQRLATGGIDGTVRIWSTKAIFNSMSPVTQSLPRQLCSLAHHTGAVHAVRFSGNNRYLASGSDDKIVLVYERDVNATSRPAFGSGEGHTETWRTHRRLANHDHDVIDLGWSADSSILVSVGLDSKVIVWSGTTFERLKRIDMHQSHVKGITFDPANKYFATASDDRTVKVFRFQSPASNATAHDQAMNFQLETSITGPFQESPLTTYFRRCSWSPDGSHIAAANAVNGPVSSVAILNRGTWDSDINLIGHEGPVEVCAFAPRMFSREPLEPGVPVSPVTVIACAGQDKSLSIWNTSNPRPLVITQDIATKALSDLAWSPDGTSLFISSLDGSIICMVFEPGDLGYVMGPEENERILQKFGTSRKGATLPESIENARLEEFSRVGERRELEGRMGQLMMHGPSAGNLPIPIPGNSQWEVQASQVPAPIQSPQPERPFKQKITITKDGKKRVAPLLVSSGGGGHRSNLPNTQLLQAQNASSGPSTDPKVILDISTPYDGLPKGGLTSFVLGNKRKPQEDDVEPTSTNFSKRVAIHSAPAPRTAIVTPEFIRPAIVSPSVSVSQVRLGIPKVRTIVQRAIDRNGEPSSAVPPAGSTTAPSTFDSGDTVFEARNSAHPTRITISRGGKMLWIDFVPRPVLLVAGNNNFWACATEDGIIYAFSPVGRRFANPIILEAQPCFLDSRGWYLFCISAVGTAHVWNMKSQTALHPPISVAPILDVANIIPKPDGPISKAEAILDAAITGNGSMMISLSNGDGFTYNRDMCVWQRISETWWAVGSSYWDTTPVRTGLVSRLERRTTDQALLHGRGKFFNRIFKQALSREGFEGMEAAISVAHLENRMAAAITLGSKTEFKNTLMIYAKRIAAEGVAGKVEELLRELMGGLDDDDDEEGDDGSRTDKDLICGFKRRELLKAVLLAIGKYRDLQRVTLPYARIIGILDDVTVAAEEQLRTEDQARTSDPGPCNGKTTITRDDGDEPME
ncbi:Hira-domain-containing protein [Ascodesmis nigricans]|uniref:Protein HIR n=1 Tax=Ascodesmis nigricans TaxID=341454 RepID=A0A4V3SI93_9PEZI|nr:Hira-domain-containing protein [Ascodesmis nigricans]